MSLRTLAFAIACFILIPSSSCGRKKMSERDIRREQLRVNAQKKRKELAPLEGGYRGKFIVGGKAQDASLAIEIKDLPETEDGQVDPVLMPTMSGSVRLTYGYGEDLEFFSFGTTKADFDIQQNKLDLVVSNGTFKDINLSLILSDKNLSGTWTAPSSSSSGTAEFIRSTDLLLAGVTPEFRGKYSGYLEWQNKPLFHAAVLSIATAQDNSDTFHINSNLRMIAESQGFSETIAIDFDQQEYNPLNRQLTLRSTDDDVYLVGTHLGKEIVGDWFSKKFGRMGGFSLATSGNTIPQSKTLIKALSGTYYAEIINTRSDSRLPKNLMLSFSSHVDQEAPGTLVFSGSSRFYFGSFAGSDYIESHFSKVENVIFGRKIFALTSGDPALTFNIDVGDGGELIGQIIDSSLGLVGTFNTAASVQDSPASSSIGGEYSGYALRQQDRLYHDLKITLLPTTGPEGLKISASVNLFFGFGNSETLLYKFENLDFNPVTGLINMSGNNSDIVIRGRLEGTQISGEWLSQTTGLMGSIVATKGIQASPPTNYQRLGNVRGTYQGTITNTSAQTNLPDRLQIGLVSSQNPNTERGFAVTGMSRLYIGSFGSTEYVELPFESLVFDPFRRHFVARTQGTYRLTLQGSFSGEDDISGTISDDALGQIGTFSIQRTSL